MQDHQLFEKLALQNRKRIPEPVIHAKGWSAFGTFPVTNGIVPFCCALIFCEVGKTPDMPARFPTVAGKQGVADHARDVRGFVRKF